jgi:hypothetical protein
MHALPKGAASIQIAIIHEFLTSCAGDMRHEAAKLPKPGE